VVAVFVGIISFDKLPSTIGDNAEFAILARALASGHGFRYLNHPDLQPSTKYPPGFPLLLAMWIPLFGESMVVMKVVVLGCYVLAVVAAFLLGRKLVDERLSLVAALMIGTSASILPYSHEVLSDIPYALFSLVALLLIMDVKVGRRTLVTGLAICMWAYVVRTAGVSLVLAAALYLFLRARRKEAYALGLAFILFSALWAIRNHLVAGEGSRYVGVLLAKNPYNPDLGPVGAADLARRVWINLSAYVGGLLPLSFLPTLAGYTREAPLRALVSLVILVVAGLGCFSLRKRGLLPNLYILAYMIVYLLWPEVWRTERFMLPIAPLVAIYLVGGVQRICSYVELRRLATLVVCIAIAATNLYSLSKYATRMRGYPPGWNNYFATATWAKANTKPDAVFLCRSAFLFYVVSERKAIQYPFTADAQAMRAYLIKSHPDYIVLDSVGFPQTRTYLVPVIRTMQVMLNPVYETPEPVNAVLKFSPEGGGGN
jgi:4-amino-4-deoxy-L-arabinose transferase-like glycosyltransferase